MKSRKLFPVLLSAFLFALYGNGCNGDNGDEDATDVTEIDDGAHEAADVPPDEEDPDMVEEDPIDTIEDEAEAPPQPARVIILHTNDEHSQILGNGPNVDDWPPAMDAGDGSLKGNIYRRAVVLNRERLAASEEGIPTLTLSAGDITMGSLFHLGSVLEGIDLKLMLVLNYDAVTIGNHEFDFGAATVATMIEKGGLLGGPTEIPIVTSNIHFSSGSGDDALEALYAFDGSGTIVKGYYTKNLPDGTSVGIIGYLGLDAALVAPFKSPIYFSFAFTDQECTESFECDGGSCVEGYCTVGAIQDHAAHMPALIADVADAVRAVRAEGVDLVIALSHAGVSDQEVVDIAAGTLDPLDAQHSEDLIVAREVTRTLAAEDMKGIDVIVSGHSHTVIPSPIVVPDPEGGDHGTIVVQAGAYGRYLGRLEIYRDDAGEPWQVEADGSYLIEVDDTIPISELIPVTKSLIDQVVEGTVEAVEGAVLEDAINVYNPGAPISDDTGIIGDLFFYPVAEAAYDVPGKVPHRESMILNLATDAFRETLNQFVYPSDPVIAYIQANGVVRDNLQAGRVDGALSLADIFSVVCLGVSPMEESPGYPMIDFYLTAGELKAALEIGVSMGFESSSFFLDYSGVKIEYDPNLPPFDPDAPLTTGRVTQMTFWDPVADAGLLPWEDDYTDVIFDITVSPDPFSGRIDEPVHVATNLYIGLFIDGFGICPRNSSGEMDPLCGLCANTDADCDDGLGNTAHCLNDVVEPGVGRCIAGSIPSVIKYATHLPGPGPEVKEWLSLIGFLQNLPDTSGNGVPELPDAYDPDAPGVSFPSRVCCVQSSLSPTDICCYEEPCPTNYVACP